MFGLAISLWVFRLFIRGECHESCSTVKKNRKTKLYFVNDAIGQLHGYVTLTMWKLRKRRFSPLWINAHEAKRLSLLCVLMCTDFYSVLTRSDNLQVLTPNHFLTGKTTKCFNSSRFPQNEIYFWRDLGYSPTLQ